MDMIDAGKASLVRLLALVALAGVAAAAVLGVVAHLDATANLNPLTLTISDYAVSDRGGAMDAAMLVLGVGSLALPAGLWLASRPIARRVIGLLLVWCLGLVASAFVPTDPPGAPEMTVTGYAHRYVSVAAFVCLPAAAFALLRTTHAKAVRTLATASIVGLLVLLYVAFPGERVLMGLAERLLVGVEMALLAAMAVPLLRMRPAATPTTYVPMPEDARELISVG